MRGNRSLPPVCTRRCLAALALLGVAVVLSQSVGCSVRSSKSESIEMIGFVGGDFGLLGEPLVDLKQSDFSGPFPVTHHIEVRPTPRTVVVDEEGHRFTWASLGIGKSHERRPGFLDRSSSVQVSASPSRSGLRAEWIAYAGKAKNLSVAPFLKRDWYQTVGAVTIEATMVVVDVSTEESGGSVRRIVRLATPRTREGAAFVSHVVTATVDPKSSLDKLLADGDRGSFLGLTDRQLVVILKRQNTGLVLDSLRKGPVLRRNEEPVTGF